MDQTIKTKWPRNPIENANMFSIITYAYLIPTLVKGYFKNIEKEDIPKILDEHCASGLGDKLEHEWKRERKRGGDSLWPPIKRTFGIEFGVLGAFLAIDDLVLKMIRPLAVAQLLKYYSLNEGKHMGGEESLIWAAVIVTVSLISSLIFHFASINLQLLGMKIRVACCSLIYRKALTLSKSSLASTAVGQITNLLSNDVSRIDSAVCTAHAIWKVPFQIVLTIVIMYEMLGLHSILGILIMLLLVPIQVYLGNKLSKLRLKTALQTDERVRLMNELVYGIKVIKMYTWEKMFEEIVQEKRRLEMTEVQSANDIRSFLKSSAYSQKLSIFLAIITYVLTGNELTALYAFTITCFYESIRIPVCINFINGIADVAELRVSMNRITKFLLSKEVDADAFQCSYNSIPQSQLTINKQKREKQNKLGIELNNIKAKWCPNSLETTLAEITLRISFEEHVGIVGPVGSGKSSMLELILKELPMQNGLMEVNGKMSYAPQEPWIFAGNIRQNIIFDTPMNEMRYKNVIQACALEQDLQTLPYGDQTLVGERGVALSGGQKARVNLARAIYVDADIYLLDDPLSAVDTRVGLHIFHNCIQQFLSNKCVVLVTHQVRFLQNFKKIYLIESGKILIEGTLTDILQYGSNFSNELKYGYEEKTTIAEKSVTNNWNNRNEKQNSADIRQAYISSDVGNSFVSYIKAGGSLPAFILVMLIAFISQVTVAGGEFYIAYWINQHQNLDTNQNSSWLSVKEFVYGYSSITILMTITLLLQAVTFFRFCTRVAVKLHNNMFSSVMKTSLLFFNINNSGKILNRFSKDIGVIDEQIPIVGIETTKIITRLILGIILICFCSLWLIIPSAVLLLGFYIARTVYYATNRNLKFIESSARSPVYGHLSATLQGISTIRAFGAQENLRKEFDYYQDIHSSAWSLFLSSTRTFVFYIDVLCIIYIAATTFTLLMVKTDRYAGNIGLAINQGILILLTQQWGMLQSTELENCMTSVDRVVDYANLKPEDAETFNEPSSSWPERGTINFQSLSLQYSSNEPVILKNLNFSIHANEKIGIVGRTGAGKSSLITALFQLVRTQGSIVIDDINIAEISLYSLRSKISIIPQEPVLFSGTLRKNLDPFNLSSDEDLWLSLQEVELKTVVDKLPLGLSCIISEGGSNFSVGQRQLICLARAILRKNKILILDEATANVDPYTDTLIQSTLRRKFKNCTVLTVAHRLNTIIDCDRVLVMEDGQLVEFEHPYRLLQKGQGSFYSMVQQTGHDNAQYLTDIAEDSFKKLLEDSITP